MKQRAISFMLGNKWKKLLLTFDVINSENFIKFLKLLKNKSIMDNFRYNNFSLQKRTSIIFKKLNSQISTLRKFTENFCFILWNKTFFLI